MSSYLSRRMNLYHVLLYIINNEKSSDFTLYLWLRQFTVIHQICLAALACDNNIYKNGSITQDMIIDKKQLHVNGCRCEEYFNLLFDDVCMFSCVNYSTFKCIYNGKNYSSKMACINDFTNLLDKKCIPDQSNIITETSTKPKQIYNLNVDIKSLKNINSFNVPSHEYTFSSDIDTSIYYNDQYNDTFSIYGIQHALTNPNFSWNSIVPMINCFEFYAIYILLKKEYFSRTMFEFILPEYLRSNTRSNKKCKISIESMVSITYNYITKFLIELPKQTKTTIAVREGNICEINQKQVFNFLNTNIDYNNILQLNYKGIKCYVHIFYKRIYIFDDYGRKIKFNTKLTTLPFHLFVNDVILLECIKITKSSDIYQSGYCDFNENEVFIILDVLYYNKNLINTEPFNKRMLYFEELAVLINQRTEAHLKNIKFEASKLYKHTEFSDIYNIYQNLFSLFTQSTLYFNGIIIRPFVINAITHNNAQQQQSYIFKFKFSTTKYIVIDNVENGIYIPPIFDRLNYKQNFDIDKNVYEQLTNSKLIINLPMVNSINDKAIIVPDYESKFYAYFIITKLISRQILSLIIFNEHKFDFYINISSIGLDLIISSQYKLKVNKKRYKVGIVKVGFDSWNPVDNCISDIRYIRNAPFRNILNCVTKQELVSFGKLNQIST